jgi:UDP-glucose 4-epimerase
VLRRIGAVTGRPVPYQVGPRRPGDPAEVVADASRIRRELGWHARYGLTEMIASTWLAWSELSGPVPARAAVGRSA